MFQQTELEKWQKRLKREKNARLQAEALLEAKSLELYQINKNLEEKVLERTIQLKEETQKALNLSKSKSDFLAIMSHEIRTPLNAVLGILQLLQQMQLSKEAKELINMGASSSEILLHVVNDVLDFSKIEAGKFVLTYQNFNLGLQLKNIILIFQKQLEGTDTTLSFSLDEQISEYVYADSYHLTQVLNNYISNAIKFTKKGSIKVHASLQDAYLEFSVIDTGIGISDSDRHKIFRDFSQVDDSIARNYDGTGLGLVISKKIIELMKGEVGFSSIVGKGSHFWARIPYTPATAQTTAQTETKQNMYLGDEVTILLVDDNQVNTIVAKKLLEQITPNVDTASSGQEAIDKLRLKKYSLVLMDINMPTMSGIETTQHIRTFNTTTPIVALTANSSESDKELVLQSDMNGFVTKPFNIAEIYTYLQT